MHCIRGSQFSDSCGRKLLPLGAANPALRDTKLAAPPRAPLMQYIRFLDVLNTTFEVGLLGFR